MLSVKLRVVLSLCFIVFVCSIIYEYVSSFREGMGSESDSKLNEPPLTQNEYHVIDTILNKLVIDDPSGVSSFDVSALIQISSTHPKYAKIISGNQSISDKMKSTRELLKMENAANTKDPFKS